MTHTELLDQAMSLSTSEKLLLVDELWEAIANDPAGLSLSDAERNELRRRAELAQSRGSAAQSWPQSRERILNNIRGVK